MATLVLTALGNTIGGALGGVGAAVGGAVGALAGQAVDSLIFRPGSRSGPRLSDLQVQTSRYGAQIPRLYGTIRAAGTVIWSTDLQESNETSGGKGQPDVTRYSYSASFAVALSARAIGRIGRIWADGNLLRGAAGDFKAPVGAFRVHLGAQDQAVDALIAADVGLDEAPAYRGCAYVVFEGLQLADYGNRIPSLTFEVIADPGPLGIGAILSDLAGVPIAYAGKDEEPGFSGFAAAGDDLRDATAALVDAYDLQWREREGGLALIAGVSVDHVLDPAREVRAIDGERERPGRKQRLPIESVPVRLGVRHHDAARDFQVGIQTAERPGPGRHSQDYDLPAVLSADDARALADRKLRTALRRRHVLHRAVDWTALDLAVGDVVTIDGEPGRWLVEASDWDDMAVRLRLRAFETGTRAASAGASGNPVLEQDLAQGATHLAIVEMPGDGASLATAPSVFCAATGANAGWRRAALFRYRPEPEAAEPIGRTAPRAVLGVAVTILPDGTPWRIDRRGTVEVELDNEADALVSAEDDLLLQGANLCQIGAELLQFGHAEPIGPGRYRLSRLVRGWHGTEWASGGHVAGERFVLIDAARMASVEVASADVGQTLTLRAVGSGEVVPAEALRMIDGRAMRPPSPVHGRMVMLAGGDLAISWVRRSRLGWTWPDGTDVPLGEELEAYAVRVTANGTVLREWATGAPLATYLAADIAADALAGDPWPLQLQIRQHGTWGLSHALMLDLP